MASDDPRNIAYTLYDRATGAILSSGIAGNAWSLNWRITDAVGAVLDVRADSRTHRVEMIDGEPTIVWREDRQTEE